MTTPGSAGRAVAVIAFGFVAWMHWQAAVAFFGWVLYAAVGGRDGNKNGRA